MESLAHQKEFREIREQVKDCFSQFVANFQATLRRSLVQLAHNSYRKEQRAQEKRQKRFVKQVPRRSRARQFEVNSASVAQAPPAPPAFEAHIVEWREIHTTEHYGIYVIEVAFEDGRPRKTVYRRFREFESLYRKHSSLLTDVKLPNTSSSTSSIQAGGPSKRRSSIERFFTGNENKWDRRYHDQRARSLQPLLDSLCSQPNAWQLPLLRRFLDLDSPDDDIVSKSFFLTIETLRRKFGIQHFMSTNDKIECLARLMFYRIEPIWLEIKKNCPGKPIKALAARTVQDILVKQARSWDEMVTQATILQTKMLSSIKAGISDLHAAMQAALGLIPSDVKNQAENLIPKQQLESVLSDFAGELIQQLPDLWNMIEPGMVEATHVLEHALDSPGSETISLLTKFQGIIASLREIVSTPLFGPRGMLMSALQRVSASRNGGNSSNLSPDMMPLASLLESHKILQELLPICLDAVLAPARPVADILGEIVVIRISLSNIDMKASTATSRVDQVLSNLETTMRDRIIDLRERLGSDGHEILSKLRRRRQRHFTAEPQLLEPLEEFLLDLTKIWPRVVKKITHKFSDYVWVLARQYAQEEEAALHEMSGTGDNIGPRRRELSSLPRWSTTVGDAFAVACLKGFGFIMKSVKRLLNKVMRSYILSCLETVSDAITTLSKSPQLNTSASGAIASAASPANLADLLDAQTCLKLVMDERFRTVVDEIVDRKLVEPVTRAWAEVQASTGTNYSETLLSRATSLRARDAQLWNFQQQLYRVGTRTRDLNDPSLNRPASPPPLSSSPPFALLSSSPPLQGGSTNTTYFDRMMSMRNGSVSPPPAARINAAVSVAANSAPSLVAPVQRSQTVAGFHVQSTVSSAPTTANPAFVHGTMTNRVTPGRRGQGSQNALNAPSYATVRGGNQPGAPPMPAPPPSNPTMTRYARDAIQERRRAAHEGGSSSTSYGEISLPSNVNPNYIRPGLDPFSVSANKPATSIPIATASSIAIGSTPNQYSRSPPTVADNMGNDPNYAVPYYTQDAYLDPYYSNYQEEEADEAEPNFAPLPDRVNRISHVRLTMVNLDTSSIQGDINPDELFSFDYDGSAHDDGGDSSETDSAEEPIALQPRTPEITIAETQDPATSQLHPDQVLLRDSKYPLVQRRKSSINPAYKNIFSFAADQVPFPRRPAEDDDQAQNDDDWGDDSVQQPQPAYQSQSVATQQQPRSPPAPVVTVAPHQPKQWSKPPTFQSGPTPQQQQQQQPQQQRSPSQGSSGHGSPPQQQRAPSQGASGQSSQQQQRNHSQGSSAKQGASPKFPAQQQQQRSPAQGNRPAMVPQHRSQAQLKAPAKFPAQQPPKLPAAPPQQPAKSGTYAQHAQQPPRGLVSAQSQPVMRVNILQNPQQQPQQQQSQHQHARPQQPGTLFPRQPPPGGY